MKGANVSEERALRDSGSDLRPSRVLASALVAVLLVASAGHVLADEPSGNITMVHLNPTVWTVVGEAARLYGVQVVMVGEESVDAGAPPRVFSVNGLGAAEFMAEVAVKYPRHVVERHPRHDVWLVYPRGAEWTWYHNRAQFRATRKENTRSAMDEVMDAVPNGVARHVEATDGPRSRRGSMGVAAARGLYLEPPPGEGVVLSAFEGPVWHRIAEVLATERRTYFVATNRRAEAPDGTREGPGDEGRWRCFWTIGSTEDWCALEDEEILARMEGAKQARPDLRGYLSFQPLDRLARLTDRIVGDHYDLRAWAWVAWTPRLRFTDWAVWVAAREIGQPDSLASLQILLANATCPHVQQFLMRHIEEADEEWMLRAYPILAKAPADLPEKVWRAWELHIAQARSREMDLRAEAWALPRPGGVRIGDDGGGVPSEQVADPEQVARIRRRFEEVFAAAPVADQAVRRRAAEGRRRLEEILGVDPDRTFGHMLPNNPSQAKADQ